MNLHGLAGPAYHRFSVGSPEALPPIRGTTSLIAHDERCDWVADAKYKTSMEGPRESDVYQLLAYTIAADVPWGVLIYADGKASRHTTRYSGKRLDVTAIDLTQNPSEILRQVEVLARQMDEMHELRRTPVRAS